MTTTMSTIGIKNNIFIVYTSHEEKIAEYLQALLKQWGYHSFYCRQLDDRRALSLGTYITDLRNNLEKANLVIFILSQEFQWSKYAQGEVGATMFKGTPRINILIPPADLESVRTIAPMLEDHESIVAEVSEQESFFTNLRVRLASILKTDNRQSPVDADALKESQQHLWEAILTAIQDYRLNLPKRVEARVWDSIKKDTAAHFSIVANIKKSFRSDSAHTKLVFVGVSLKFSLALISQALQEFVSEVKIDGGPPKRRRKTIEITLVYMDDLSHILHTLSDYDDIRTIRRNLNENESRKKTWKSYCREASISLGEVIQYRIDYIPPRVGILIDAQILYAGQCYFEPAGTSEDGTPVEAYRLLVGERNYFYYTDKDDRGKDAIKDFKASVDVYSDPKNNGVMLALNRIEWVERLRSCIETYGDVNEVILISETCSKFENLVTAALSDLGSRHGLKRIKIYVRDPKDAVLSRASRALIESLPNKIQGLIGGGGTPGKGVAEIYYYRHEPIFRAALIGNAVLGVQMYERRQDDSGALVLKPGPLRIIAARYSSQFEGLREMVAGFLSLNSVDRIPSHIIKHL